MQISMQINTEGTMKFYFTFGYNHVDRRNLSLGNMCAEVEAASYGEAREMMFDARGDKWSFQYSTAEEAGVTLYGLRVVTLEDVRIIY